MAETNIITNLSGKFIGTVVSIDKNLRTVEAFIPKLMPAVQENRQDITTKTNLGNSTITIPYENNIKVSSTFTLHARNASDPMPTNGSHVLIWFVDENPQLGVWEPFNYNGDYDEIPDEKYPEQAELTIGDKTIKINKNDDIRITLPADYDIIQLNKGKTKIFKLKNTSDSSYRLDNIEKTLGSPSMTRVETGTDGKTKTSNTSATGVFKDIEDLREDIKKAGSNDITGDLILKNRESLKFRNSNDTVALTSELNSLDSKVNTISASQNFTATVKKYSDLSGLSVGLYDNKDCVLVLEDENHDNKSDIYQWNGSSFDYVGELNSSYAKSEINEMLSKKQDKLQPTGSETSPVYIDANGNPQVAMINNVVANSGGSDGAQNLDTLTVNGTTYKIKSSDVSFSSSQTNGTPIGTLTINGASYNLYAPTPEVKQPRSITGVEKTQSDGLKDTYMIKFSDGTASSYIVTNGANGQAGHSPVINIGDDNTWLIDNKTTGVKATGHSPVVSIGSNGNWLIDSADTGKTSIGTPGINGTNAVIKGSYNSLDELTAAHPVGNTSESYLINGELYSWNNKWTDVGNIRGDKGDTIVPKVDPDTGLLSWTRMHEPPATVQPIHIIPSIDADTNDWKIGDTDLGIKAVGKSAYDVARDNGYTDTEANWLNSLKAKEPTITTSRNGSITDLLVDGSKIASINDGAPGASGASAYDIAKNNGYAGDQKSWLSSLKGDPGKDGHSPAISLTKNNGITTLKIDDLSQTILDGAPGANGATFTPFVDENGNLSWSNNSNLSNPVTRNIKGIQGEPGHTPNISLTKNNGVTTLKIDNLSQNINDGAPGANGITFTPSVSNGVLSWSNNGGLQNPASQNIKGDPGGTGPQGPRGADGHSPTVSIGDNGNWLIDGADTQRPSIGAAGPTGKSAYDIAAENGFTGTEAEWLASLKGEKGDKGDRGPKGDTGSSGGSTAELPDWVFPKTSGIYFRNVGHASDAIVNEEAYENDQMYTPGSADFIMCSAPISATTFDNGTEDEGRDVLSDMISRSRHGEDVGSDLTSYLESYMGGYGLTYQQNEFPDGVPVFDIYITWDARIVSKHLAIVSPATSSPYMIVVDFYNTTTGTFYGYSTMSVDSITLI